MKKIDLKTTPKRPDVYIPGSLEVALDLYVERNLYVGGRIYQKGIDLPFLLLVCISSLVGVALGILLGNNFIDFLRLP